MSENKKNTKTTSIDNDVRKLVITRLSALSSNTRISLGSEGSFTPSDLIKSIEKGDKVGEKIIEIEIEWLRSFKEKVLV